MSQITLSTLKKRKVKQVTYVIEIMKLSVGYTTVHDFGINKSRCSDAYFNADAYRKIIAQCNDPSPALEILAIINGSSLISSPLVQEKQIDAIPARIAKP